MQQVESEKPGLINSFECDNQNTSDNSEKFHSSIQFKTYDNRVKQPQLNLKSISNIYGNGGGYHNNHYTNNNGFNSSSKDTEEYGDQVDEIQEIMSPTKSIKKRSNSLSLDRVKLQVIFRKNRQHRIRDTQRNELKPINTKYSNIEKITKEKSDTDIFFIENILEQHFLFSKVEDSEVITEFAKKFFYCKLKDQFVFKEKEEPGLFYIIEKGELEKIFLGKTREFLKKEDTFGDFDILRDSPRSATIKALDNSECYFWAIDKRTYMQYADKILADEIQENKEVIVNHEFFDMMTEEQRDEILHVTYTKMFRIGQDLCSRDDVATSYYIIKEGNVLVKDGKRDKKKLGPGDQIGYEEFIYSKPHKYQYIALNSKIMCLKIDKANIERYIGEDLINFYHKNVQRYACENHELIGKLGLTDIERIIANSKFTQYQQGDILVQKGQIIPKLYFVINSRIVCKCEETQEKTHDSNSEKNDDQKTVFDFGSLIFEIQQTAKGDFVVEKGGTLAEIATDNFLELVGDQEILGDSIIVPQNPYLVPFNNKCSQSSEEEMYCGPSLQKSSSWLRKSLKKSNPLQIRYNKSYDNLKMLGEQWIPNNHESIPEFGNFESNNGSQVLNNSSGLQKSQIIRSFSPNQKNQLIQNNTHTLAGIAKQTVSLGAITINPTKLEEIPQKLTEKQNVGDYIHIKQIGSGCFGITHLCQNIHDKQLYALKVIQKADIIEKHMEKQVIEEKEIQQALNHPFIMKYYGSFMDEFNIYFVLQHINGIELFDCIRQKGVFNAEDLLYYAASLVNILEYLHSEQIVYRDLKPENIMINQEGEVKLIDLGASTRLTEKGGRTFTITGTAHYMAPEIVEGKGYSYYVDLWSLGIVLYECLCGPTPFGTSDLEDPYEIYQQIKNNNLEFPDFVQNQDVKDFISKLLNKKPFKRLGGSWATLKQDPYFDIKGKFDWSQLQEDYGYQPPYQPDYELDEEEIQKAIINKKPLKDAVGKTPYDNKNCKYDPNWEELFNKVDPEQTEEEENKEN